MRPYPRAKLLGLAAEQKSRLASWLSDEKLTCRQAAVRVKEEFGVSVSLQAVNYFWHRHCVPHKLLFSAESAKCIQSAVASHKGDWQDVNAQLLGQRIFETLAAPEIDVKLVAALGSVLERVKTRSLHEKTLTARLAAEKRRDKQRERQMAFAREKFEFDAVEAALAHAPAIRTITADRKLSGDEKREQLRRLLFPQAFEAEKPAA